MDTRGGCANDVRNGVYRRGEGGGGAATHMLLRLERRP